MSKKFSYFLPTLSNILPNREVTLEDIYYLITGISAPLYEDLLPDYIQKQSRYLNEKGWTDWTKDIRVESLQINTEEVRGNLPHNPDQYKTQKKTLLPSATFGGTFSRRSKETLKESSGYITIDIDHLSDSPFTLEEVKDILQNDTEIGWKLIYISPSGDGLKIICETSAEITDDESYKRVYESLYHYISSTYGVEVDKGGKDICRTSLLCYDPESLYRFEEVSPFNPDRHPVPVVDSTPLREKFNLKDWGDDDGIEEIVRRVELSGVDIAPTQDEWIKLVYSFSALGERGRDYLHRVCKVSPKYDPKDTEDKFNYVLKRKGFKNIGTFINMARENGIDVSNPVERPQNYRDTSTIRTQSPTLQDNPGEGVPQPTEEDKYLSFLTIPDIAEVAKTKREGVPTGYAFKPQRGEYRELLLPTGAMTLICGKPGHCKSKLLQNIALQIAKSIDNGQDESVLFFTYEEELSDVLLQFANIYSNVPDLSRYGTTNIESIRDYYQTGYLNKAREDKRRQALPELEKFTALHKEGKLRVYYSDMGSLELCKVIRYISSKIKVKAVFIDYVQLLSREGHRGDRKEELKAICNDIRNTAIALGLPIVLSAQLNKEAKSPSVMSSENIADCYDLARYANTIICLWNSAYSQDCKDEGWSDSKEGKLLESRGFTLGEEGSIYSRITKNRGGTPNSDAVLEFTGETGFIKPNDDLPEGEKEEEVITPQSIQFID